MLNANEHTPGPTLDALVAEKVMGWKADGIYWRDESGRVKERREAVMFEIRWSPSTDIAAAWEVGEKLRERFFVFSIDRIETPDGTIWSCEFQPKDFHSFWRHASSWEVEECAVNGPCANLCNADTAPLAICRAALKAVEA